MLRSRRALLSGASQLSRLRSNLALCAPLRRTLSAASSPEPFDREKHGKPSWSMKTALDEAKAEQPLLTREQLKKIAALSNIEVSSEEQVAALHKDVTAFVGWVGQIRKVDTEGAKPLLSPQESEPLRLREDEVSEPADAIRVLRNAKHKDRGFFVVPKVVDHGE